MPAKLLSTIASIVGLTCGLQTHAMAAVVISGDYYEQQSNIYCQSVTPCRLELTPIPAGKILDVQNVNCVIRTDKPAIYFSMGAASASGGSSARSLYFPMPSYYFGSNHYHYAVNEAVNYRVGASPYIYFSTSHESAANNSVTCTVTGKLSPR